MSGREFTPEDSVIPEEKETLEAIRDCLQHVFRKFERCRHQDSIEIWVRGNYMDYFFKARVCCRTAKARVDWLFEKIKKELIKI